MQQVHGRFHLVDVLAAGTAGTGGADLQVARVDLNLHWIGLRHHRHRGSGGVHPPLGFGGRHPLHPVHTRLELELAEHALTTDREDQFLITA